MRATIRSIEAAKEPGFEFNAIAPAIPHMVVVFRSGARRLGTDEPENSRGL